MACRLRVVSTIVLVVRVFDVFTDPLCGYLCDRTDTRWGRRRPWIAAAAPVMMLSIYMLFMPPEGAGGDPHGDVDDRVEPRHNHDAHSVLRLGG